MGIEDKKREKSGFTAEEFSRGAKQAENVLQEADKLTMGVKYEEYGDSAIECQRIAEYWTTLFGHKVRADQVPLAMMLLKISRQQHRHKRDNLVDIAGYARVSEHVMAQCFDSNRPFVDPPVPDDVKRQIEEKTQEILRIYALEQEVGRGPDEVLEIPECPPERPTEQQLERLRKLGLEIDRKLQEEERERDARRASGEHLCADGTCEYPDVDCECGRKPKT